MEERCVGNEGESASTNGRLQIYSAAFRNERTFLAWIRTAIAITGIGVLIINLHIKSSHHSLSNMAVEMIGTLSVITGVCTIVFATVSYFQNAKQINEQTFRTTRFLATFFIFIR